MEALGPGRDIAIDVHKKHWVWVAVDRATGTEVCRRRLPAREAEEWLLGWVQSGDRVVMEATRGSHRLANRLETTGAMVLVVDAAQARLIGRNGKKTDYRDCRALLQHLRADSLVVVWRPDAETRELRQLSKERVALNQSIVHFKNRLQALLYEEGLQHPGEMLWTSAGGEWLSAQKLRGAASGIAAREWRTLRYLLLVKAEQERALGERSFQRPEVPRLMQITGFGPTAALFLLGEVGDPQRFATAKHLVSYAGLDPRVGQSDEHFTCGSISKAGRATLRWLLIEVAWAHVLGKGPEAEHYHRLVARGKPKNVAIVALARRLLVVAYKLLRGTENYRHVLADQYVGKLARWSAALSPEPRETTQIGWGRARAAEYGIVATAPELKAETVEPTDTAGGELATREGTALAPGIVERRRCGASSPAGRNSLWARVEEEQPSPPHSRKKPKKLVVAA
jgi:transposase